MTAMSFADFQTEHRRLVLLQALEGAVQYRANAYLLRKFSDSLGHIVSGDRIAQDLAWLREQGLVTLEDTGDLAVATLTARGLDVATGRAVVPGVQRPTPGG